MIEAPDGGQRRSQLDQRVSGRVVDQLPDGLYRVRLKEGSLVTAHLTSRVDRTFIRVLVGDEVDVELSPLDLGRGRIVGKA